MGDNMDSQKKVIITEKPSLRHPYMVCGISGWVNGGEAATGSIQYLIEKLRTKEFAQIPIEKFHIFQVPGQMSLRPHIKIEDGILKECNFPKNQFFYWVNNNEDNDLIIFFGTEPNINWEEYGHAILNIAEDFNVAKIYSLGGVLNTIPYTKEPNVSCLCSSYEMKEEMQHYGVQFISYEGPGSLSSTLIDMCIKKDMPCVSILAGANYYPEFNILITRNPKSIRALIIRLNSLLNLNLNTSDLNIQVEEFEGKLNLMANQNPTFQSYMRKLEREYIEEKFEEPLEISPDEGVQIAEEIIKRRGKNTK